MPVADFFEKLAAKEAVVGIIGLGYVGLPLTLTCTTRQFKVVGCDSDPERVALLNQGRSPIQHIDDAAIRAEVDADRFRATTDYADLAACDVVVMCVPTPLGRNHDPDMGFITQATELLAPYVHPKMLVVLESTTYPGTTDGLRARFAGEWFWTHGGQRFWLAFSPEREDPGNPTHTTRTIPKVVGGFTPACREAAVGFYGAIMDRVVPVSSNTVAEMTKLLENIFRCVNIALVNELKVLSHNLGIDIWEVINAAATKPFGFMPFYPGPGLGGHCIPIDPYYLSWVARAHDTPTRFIELAGEINATMPQYVTNRVALALNSVQKPISGSRVLVLGVAYKRDVEDLRESPALRIMEILRKQGAEVTYHDPWVPQMRQEDDISSTPLRPDTLQACDVAVIVTDHTTVDYELVVNNAPLVVDTRNATHGITCDRARMFYA